MTRALVLLIAIWATLLALLPVPLRAQENADASFLESWLEENLSSAGRVVTVRGFVGALSSNAKLASLTIADDQGVWLTMTNAELVWTRSALFKGRLDLDLLTAESITIARRPVRNALEDAAEAREFALPDLPVAIEIGTIEAKTVTLEAPVLGEKVVLGLTASATLENGGGRTDLRIARTDGTLGALDLSGAYDNRTRQLALDFSLTEAQNGLTARLLGLPDRGALALSAKGAGPIDNFSAAITLSLDQIERISGQVTLSRVPGADPAGPAATGFHADISGDISALFFPAYRDFFGDRVSLVVDGARAPDGSLDIRDLQLRTKALSLGGALLLNAAHWPERIALSGRLDAGDDDRVILPVSGAATSLRAGAFSLTYDSAVNQTWSLDLTAQAYASDTILVDDITLKGSGTLVPGAPGTRPFVDGRIDLAAQGLDAKDPALAQALGRSLIGEISFAKADGAPLDLAKVTLIGDTTALSGRGTLDRPVGLLMLEFDGQVDLVASDLAGFAGLVGTPLRGAADLSLAGKLAILGGPFDLLIDGTTTDLALGISQIDALIAGKSTLVMTAHRDDTGTEIDGFDITSDQANLSGKALFSAKTGEVEASFLIPDARVLASQLDGPLRVKLAARRTADDWTYRADGEGPGGADLALRGTFSLPQGILRDLGGQLSGQIDDLAPYGALAGRALGGALRLDTTLNFDPPTGQLTLEGSTKTTDLRLGLGQFDRLLAGQGISAFRLTRDGTGMVVLDNATITTPQLSLLASGGGDTNGPKITARAEIANLAVLVPNLPGRFVLDGAAQGGPTDWQIAATASGPAASTLTASGTVARDLARADLGLKGRAPTGFANDLIAPNRLDGMADFDLRLAGPLALDSLAGSVTARDLRLALPELGISLAPITGQVALAAGQGTLDLRAGVARGGTVAITGPVRLAAPFEADLAIGLQGVAVNIPGLVETTAEGNLTITGPLRGGALIGGDIAFGAVELRIPEAGFASSGGIPDIRHIHEPPDVRQTRDFAGLLATTTQGAGARAFRLDLRISAPARIFLRGRGLDAEFGGAITLGGTSADVRPSGGFQLIRGRLDILGRRLTLTEGAVTLLGTLDPNLSIVATTEAEGVAVTVRIEGRASSPVARFESSPTLPQEDVLALLVFGRGLDQLTPLQALKLASAVATLSGKGGSGIINNLRAGFGLDDLDLTSDAAGNIGVKIGTYLSEKVYTDLNVTADGKTEIQLNLSISPNVTAKGRVGSDGETGIGIFVEKDY